MVLGIVGATAFSLEESASLKPGESFTMGEFTITHTGANRFQYANYIQDTLKLTVSSEDKDDIILTPAKRFYIGHGSSTTEASLYTIWFSQLYVSVGDTDEQGATVVRSWWKSMVILVWLGPILMSFGAALSLTDQRLRVGAPKRSSKKRKLVNA